MFTNCPRECFGPHTVCEEHWHIMHGPQKGAVPFDCSMCKKRIQDRFPHNDDQGGMACDDCNREVIRRRLQKRK